MFASQQYTVDGVTIHVRKEGEQEYIRISGGTRLWVLVNIVKTTNVGGDPNAITKTRSKLFHLSAGLTNTKGAKLVYQGETTQTRELYKEYPGVNSYENVRVYQVSPAEGSWTHTIVEDGSSEVFPYANTVTNSNTFGKVTNFAVFRGTPVLFCYTTDITPTFNAAYTTTYSWSWAYGEGSLELINVGGDNLQAYKISETHTNNYAATISGELTTATLAVRWGANSVSHLLSNSTSVASDSSLIHITGTPFVQTAKYSIPRVLSKNGVSYTIAADSGAQHLIIAPTAPAPVADTAWQDATVSFFSQATPYPMRKLARAFTVAKDYFVAKLQAYVGATSTEYTEDTFLFPMTGWDSTSIIAPKKPMLSLPTRQYIATAMTGVSGATPALMKQELYDWPDLTVEANVLAAGGTYDRVIPTGKIIDISQHQAIIDDAEFSAALATSMSGTSALAAGAGIFTGDTVSHGGGLIYAQLTYYYDNSFAITTD